MLCERDGALLNVIKSSVLAVGTRDQTRNVLGIPYRDVIEIMGFQLTNETETSRRAIWSRVKANVKMHLIEA